MADNTANLPASEPRAESESANSPSPPVRFTPYNVDAEGQPRRLKHVTPEKMQQIIETGSSNGDLGAEPGFRGRPHGTDYVDVLPNEINQQHAAGDDDGEDVEQEVEEEEMASEPRALGEEVRSPTAGTNKRKMSTMSGPATPAAGGSDVDQVHKRGRKPGTHKKPYSRGWTEQESIHLLNLYIENPTATHKVVADLHHRKFWNADSTWPGRTHAACQQRMILLNGGSRDRALLPGVVEGLKVVLEAAEDGGADGSELDGTEAGPVVETDDEIDGGMANAQPKKRKVDTPVDGGDHPADSGTQTQDDGKGNALPTASTETDDTMENKNEQVTGDVTAAAQLLVDMSRNG